MNASDALGRTAVSRAAEAGFAGAVRELCQLGADVGGRAAVGGPYDGCTAMGWAALKGQVGGRGGAGRARG